MLGAGSTATVPCISAAILALVVIRPRRWNDAWWTTLAATAMLVLGLVPLSQCCGYELARQEDDSN